MFLYKCRSKGLFEVIIRQISTYFNKKVNSVFNNTETA